MIARVTPDGRMLADQEPSPPGTAHITVTRTPRGWTFAPTEESWQAIIEGGEISTGDTTMPAMRPGTCRKCGEATMIDGLGYCTPCYPYNDATDDFKRSVECKTRRRDIDDDQAADAYNRGDY